MNGINVVVANGGGTFIRLYEKLSEDKNLSVTQVRNDLLDIMFAVMTKKAEAVFISADLTHGDALAEKLSKLEPVVHIFAIIPYDNMLPCRISQSPYTTLLRQPIDLSAASGMIYDCLSGGSRISGEDYGKYIHNYVSETLSRLCITPNYNGYVYLREAIKMAVSDNVGTRSFSKYVYPKLAAEYNCTPSGVERNIRTVISRCWDKASAADKTEIFGTCAARPGWKPTNGEFILIVADRICRQLQTLPDHN